MPENKYHEYLGDAVYASYDGWHIWLHLNDHRSPGMIALEPDVFARLIKYRDSLQRLVAADATAEAGV